MCQTERKHSILLFISLSWKCTGTSLYWSQWLFATCLKIAFIPKTSMKYIMISLSSCIHSLLFPNFSIGKHLCTIGVCSYFVFILISYQSLIYYLILFVRYFNFFYGFIGGGTLEVSYWGWVGKPFSVGIFLFVRKCTLEWLNLIQHKFENYVWMRTEKSASWEEKNLNC